jgi:hypothetical protein
MKKIATKQTNISRAFELKEKDVKLLKTRFWCKLVGYRRGNGCQVAVSCTRISGLSYEFFAFGLANSHAPVCTVPEF